MGILLAMARRMENSHGSLADLWPRVGTEKGYVTKHVTKFRGTGQYNSRAFR